MVALLLDSSDKNLSVGLAENGTVIDAVSYEAWQRQSEYMITEIDAIMNKNHVGKDDIEAVIVSKGPGSYTGVRISLAIAKTVSFALDCPLYLVSSLEALQSYPKASICLMNARSKRSYFAVYEGEKAILKDEIKENAEVLQYIADHPEYAVCGDVAYLGLESAPFDLLANLARSQTAIHRCDEALGAKPIYLKDDYDEGKFRTVVRKMMPADLAAVLEIERTSFKAPYDEKQFLYEMNENPVAYLYTAVVDKEVVGFIDFYITFNSATIAQIAVKENYRSKGIGNLLIGQMLKDFSTQAEPVEFLTLEVRASNVRAQKFYKRHKFQVVTTKKSYYTDGEDAIYMVRNL